MSKGKERANSLMARAGYPGVEGPKPKNGMDHAQFRARGGETKAAAAAVHKHEKHDHPGEPLTKLARGGQAKKGHKTTVNVVVAGAPGAGGMAPRPPMPAPVGGGMPPHPPMAGAALPPGAGPVAPPGGVPPGAMPMRARGGSVPKMNAGAGGAKGRLEKRAYAKRG